MKSEREKKSRDFFKICEYIQRGNINKFVLGEFDPVDEN